MIASLGGANVAPDGSRNYPGSGGLVGGLSFPGGNWAYFGGAGAMYSRFTPSISNTNIAAQQATNGEQLIGPGPGVCLMETNGCLEPGGILNNIPPTTGIIPPVNPTEPIAPGVPPMAPCQDDNDPTCLPVQPLSTQTLTDIIKNLLAPTSRTNVSSLPPIFSFTNPVTGSATNMDMNKIILLAVVIIGGYFVYKKFIK